MQSEIQPYNGMLAYFSSIGKIVEIISIHGGVVTFALITDEGKLRINKTFTYCLEILA